MMGTLKFTKNKAFYSTAQNTSTKAPAQSAPKTQNTTNPKAPTKAQKEAKEFKEKLDWIEILMDRINRQVEKLDKVAGSAFSKINTRVAASEDQLKLLNDEIEKAKQGADRYLKEANSVGLSEDWAKKVREGAIDISTITNEALKDNIEEYQKWYEKYLDLTYKVVDFTEEMGTTVEERFNMISDNLQNQIDRIAHTDTVLSRTLDMISSAGRFASWQIYDRLIENENLNINALADKYEALQKAREEALATGVIEKESEADYNMVAAIEETQQAWLDATNQMLEYKNSAIEMRNSIFEYGMKLIDDLKDESDFIQELMTLNDADIFDKDTGRLTSAAHTVNAMRAMNYNLAMQQADEYGQYIKQIDEMLANDPNNSKLIDFKMQYVEQQREAIRNANEEKTAIRDLISDSYSKMIDAMRDLVSKRKEYLDTQKSELDYQRKIETQTKKVSSLRKQLLSLQGDDSESARGKRQSVSKDLKEAEKDLQQSEYEQWLSDQTKLMDDQVNAFETFLNDRLDRIEEFMLEYIDYANANSDMIHDTIQETTEKVGYTITQGMQDIWNGSSGMSSALAEYNKGFVTQFTSANATLKDIWALIDKMVTAKTAAEVKKDPVTTPTTNPSTPAPAPTGTPSGSGSSSSSKATTTASTPAPAPAPKRVGIGSLVSVSPNEPIYYDSYGRVGPNGSRQYFRNDPKYVVMRENNGYYLVRHHSSSGAAGWFKKGSVKALKTGGYTGNSEGMALLHKKERVLSAQQTKAFDQFVYEILPKFGELTKSMNTGGLSTTASIGNMNVTFNLPDVKDYADFMNRMKSDKSFEKMVQAMTVDLLAGKNKLSKNNIKF